MSWSRRRFLEATTAGDGGAGAVRPRRLQPPAEGHLLYKPYMDTFERDIVRRSVAYDKTIFDWDLSIAEKDYQNAMKVFGTVAIDAPLPYAKAVDLPFLQKAQAKYKS
jgi:hypothetical protein